MTRAKSSEVPAAKSLPAIFFGLCFGFLLQKGGVAKYHVLEGQLLLQDFTVAKIILTAIVVGMSGVLLLHAKAGVKLHIKPTKIASNTLGGLLFGVGFAFAGYCPGTGAAALGQGNLNALWYMGGMILGSALFAIASGGLKKTVDKWGAFGELTFPLLLGVRTGSFATGFAMALLLVLFSLQMFLK